MDLNSLSDDGRYADMDLSSTVEAKLGKDSKGRGAADGSGSEEESSSEEEDEDGELATAARFNS